MVSGILLMDAAMAAAYIYDELEANSHRFEAFVNGAFIVGLSVSTLSSITFILW
jgi:hypothetical protein